MKKSLFLSCLAFGLLLLLVNCTDTNSKSSVIVKPIYAMFGTAPSCASSGICKTVDSTGSAVSTLFEYNASKEILTISFLGKSLEQNQPEKKKDFMGHKEYVFDAEWKAPESLNEKLHAKKPIIVRKGQVNKLEYFEKQDSFAMHIDVSGKDLK